MTSPTRETDLFDSLLNLEDKYHAEGFATGFADGARAGRIEGRTFGLEKGFEKFTELGRLGGRADVWAARVQPPTFDSNPSSAGPSSDSGSVAGLQRHAKLEPPVKGSDRLTRQLSRLQELTDPESLSTVNDEESVNLFDERLREARAKATLVGKMVGESQLEQDDGSRGGGGAGVRLKGAKSSGGGSGKGGGEMEDFAGLRVPGLAREKKAGR